MAIPMHDFGLVLHPSGASEAGEAFGASGGQLSDYILDWTGGSTLPHVEIDSVQNLGVHVIVTVGFTTTALTLQVLAGNTAAMSTANAKVVGERVLAVADLVLGAHFFIPFFTNGGYRYLGLLGSCSAQDATGEIYAFVGPGPAGAN